MKSDTHSGFPASASLFSGDICVALEWGDEKSYELHAEEARLLSPRALEKRRREFYLGRAAAHAALRRLLGTTPPPVLKGARGEPLWPERVVGAITHTVDIGVAAVGRTEHTNGIGIDLERADRGVSPAVAHMVCTPRELRWVYESASEADLRLKMIFSAKESVFKAFYPIGKIFLDFMDAELSWNTQERLFVGTLLRSVARQYRVGYGFTVGCRTGDGHIFTFMSLPPASGCELLPRSLSE